MGLETRIRWIKRKFNPEALRASACLNLTSRCIILHWYRTVPNWGDALSPILAGFLSGREVVPHDIVLNLRNHPVYAVIGSILAASTDPNLVVWGSGFLRHGQKMRVKPRRIHAVRGPLTRKILLDDGIECPDVFGDPALLLPMFYYPQPRPEPRYVLGVIPHYQERDSELVQRLSRHPDVVIIDVTGDVRAVVDQVLSCEMVASSSLHGLILADAYGIPSTWVTFDDRNRRGPGWMFKYEDYGAAVGRKMELLSGRAALEPETIRSAAWDGKPDFDAHALLAACPFYDGRSEERTLFG